MIEIDKLLSVFCNTLPQGLAFQPSDTSVNDYFPAAAESNDDEIALVDLKDLENLKPVAITPKYPIDMQVVAIDSTNFTLGQITDGLVGAMRASIITKAPGKTSHSLERYGPYLVPITNQNKESIHKGTFKAIYETVTDATTPDCYNTFIIIRSWLERYIQAETVKACKNSLVLLDGSLFAGATGDPPFVLRKILGDAASNGNSVVAISKATGLTLQKTQRNILSLLDGISGPCYIGDIKKHMTQNPNRYLGEVYVVKLTPLGEPFRIDIPKGAPLSHDEVISKIAGIAGDYGYPEELKLAHMTCVFSAIEILELQAVAIALHNLNMKEELRTKIFPL